MIKGVLKKDGNLDTRALSQWNPESLAAWDLMRKLIKRPDGKTGASFDDWLATQLIQMEQEYGERFTEEAHTVVSVFQQKKNNAPTAKKNKKRGGTQLTAPKKKKQKEQSKPTQ